MALFSRLRTNLNLLIKHRGLAISSIFSSSQNENAVVDSREKTRTAISVLKSESNPEKIIQICRDTFITLESYLDYTAISIAISKLSQANHFNGISHFLEDLKTRPDLKRGGHFIPHLILLYGQANMADRAIRTFEEMDKHGFRHSLRALNALLSALTLAKDYKEVKRVFAEFPKIYGIVPDLSTYNKMIKAFCESGDSSSAYSILAEMDRISIKPNEATFGILLGGFYKEQKFEDVGKIMEMTEKYGIISGLSLHNRRILSLCNSKRSEEAKVLFDGMLSTAMEPDAVTYNHLIHGFCREGNLQEAMKLFKTMINRGIEPSKEFCFTMVYFLCRGGDYDTALKVCKEIMAKGWVPRVSIMKLLVNGLANTSKVTEAKELLGVLKEKSSEKVDKWNEIEAGLLHE